jgi:6-phosphogluconolactonase (cycloisomerase 2 family)
MSTWSHPFSRGAPAHRLASTCAGLAIVLAIMPGRAGAQQLVDLNAAVAAVKCQRALAQGGALFAGHKLRNLDGCTTAVLRCVQTKSSDPKCLAAAGARCTRLLARIFGVEDASLGASIVKKCASSVVSFADLMSGDGVGYANVVEHCQAEAGITVSDLPSLAACIVREHQRQPDLVFASANPRARELITSAGATVPDASDLPDFGGDGNGVNDPTGTGKVIQQCTSTISKAASTFMVRSMHGLEHCVERVFTCVQTTTQTAAVGKVENVDPKSCMPSSRAICDGEFAAIAAQASALRHAIDRRCAEHLVPFATLRAAHAANLDALAAECQTYGIAHLDSLADYEECVTRAHTCRAESLLLFQLPRAQELIAYDARQFRSAFCSETDASVMTLADAKFHVAGGAPGLDGGRSVALSGDSAHVYVASYNDDSLSVFSRDATSGALTPLEVHVDAVNGADGLNGARSVAVSPDDAHVYVASSKDDAVAVFQRDPVTGALTYVQRKKNGAGVLDSMNGARVVVVSPDGSNVYVAADPSDALAVFARDPDTGKLTFVESKKNLTDGVEGLHTPYGMALSPDGSNLYVASFGDDAVAVFARNAATGALTFVERKTNLVDGIVGLDGARAVAVSPDGAHVYVAGSLSRALVVFTRDATTGALTPASIRRHVFAARDGLTRPTAVAISSDGAHVYVGSAFDNIVAGYHREPSTGALSLRASTQLTVGPDAAKPGVVALTVSSDARHLYVTESKHDLLEALTIAP